MKKIIYLLPIALLALYSCTKESLDVEYTEYITADRKEELLTDPASAVKIIKSEMKGVYSLFQIYDLNGNTSHDYFGLKALHLATDLTGEDMVQHAHSHFGFDYNIDNRMNINRRTRLMWQLFYKVISTSNQMLEKYFSKDVDDAQLNALKAELLTLRGISYYYLVNFYQQTYKGNESALGVPLMLKSTDDQLPRASVQQVYDQIVLDLTYGVENGANTGDTRDADRAVAAAYLAKAYASMENWPKVEEIAPLAYAGKSIQLQNSFCKFDYPDVLWAYDINAETSTIYASLYSHLDNSSDGYTTYSGAYKKIHNLLYNKISNSDQRKKWFVSATYKPEQYNFMPDFSSIKWITPSDFTGDYIYIRTADPYLLHVEALVEQGKTAEAKSLLNDFVMLRDGAFNVDAVTDLREEVRLQRRIELWGEGTSFIDFKRWKLPINRTATGTNHRTKKNVAVGGVEWVYQLPISAMEANPNLVQNP